MATKNLLVRAGFDASPLLRGTQKATKNLNKFGSQANAQMAKINSSLSSSLGKMGKVLGGVAALGGLVLFSKQCIQLGSDLQEVQNVVDVTFGEMASTVDAFAKKSIESFGLSETSAKRYVGTMGAMLKSSGLATKDAMNMSIALTSLSGDIASFYNINNKDAFTKIRAGMAGEIMPLRELGINMTVATLEAYALSKGIKKTYQQMSQAEQMMLRYNYLLSVTGDVQGDFSRTSGSWANQTRILSEQFNTLKATLGQAFINMLTPVVKVLNSIILKLQQVAAYFKAFTEAVFGKQTASAGTAQKSLEDTTDATGDLASGYDDLGDSVEAAGKKAKGALAGFDEVNQLNIPSADGGNGGISPGAVETPDLGFTIQDETVELTNFEKVLDRTKNKMKELFDLFKKGFDITFNPKGIESIKEIIASIGESLSNIFNDSALQSAFSTFVNSVVFNLGKIAGSVASIGISIAQGLLGGISKWLDTNKDYFKEKFIKLFNIGTEISTIVGNFFDALANVFSVMGEESVQNIVANILEIFSTSFLESYELFAKIGRDVLNIFAGAFIDNQESIKEACRSILDVIKNLSDQAKIVFTTFAKSLNTTYDAHIKPAMDAVARVFSYATKSILDGYNTYIAPVLAKWGPKFTETYEKYIGPSIEKMISSFGKVIEIISIVWETCMKPFIDWMEGMFGPAFGVIFDAVGIVLNDFLTVTGTVTKGVWTAIEGLLNFLLNVFKGNWDTIWNGISNTFSNVWTDMKGIIKSTVNFIIDCINGLIRGLNKIEFSPPQWLSSVPGLSGLAGKSWGINIPTIPKLANGAVIPPNNEFLAILGDQSSGMNIETPLETMLQAFRMALSDMGGKGETVVLNVDGRELARAQASELKRMGVVFG